MMLSCKKCKNEWDYGGSNSYYATCPQCLNKVKVDTGKRKIKWIMVEYNDGSTKGYSKSAFAQRFKEMIE